MFIIFDKNKISSYLVSLATVVILFMMSFVMSASNNKILETVANITENSMIESSTNIVKNDEKNNKKSESNITANSTYIKENNTL